MNLLVLVTSTLAVILAQKDPTTVCRPDIYEVDVFDFSNNITFRTAFDLNQSKIAVLDSTDFRLVRDFTVMKQFEIYANGSCYSSAMNSSLQAPSKCLPESALPYLGWDLDDLRTLLRVDLFVFEISYPSVTFYKVFTNTTPAFHVATKIESNYGLNTIYVFSYPNISETPSTLLEIPQCCPTA